MKFGIFNLFSNPPQLTADETIANEMSQIRLADDLGFHEVWLAEHNARRYGIAGDVTMVAAAAAAATSRIRIGTAVTRNPLHNPLRLAENLAFVDHLSGGRLDWGVGKGYDALEFSTYSVPFEEREARWAECFDAVRQIWRTGRTGFEGTFTTTADAELFPPSRSPDGPPIYIMCSKSDSTIEWAAERLYPVVIGQGPDWDDARHKMQLYRAVAERHGHGAEEIDDVVSRCWQLKQVHVAETHEVAAQEYEDAFMWYYNLKNNRVMFGFPPEVQSYEYYLAHGSVILGSPDDVAADLKKYEDHTGIRNVIAWFNCGGQPQEQVAGAMSMFAEQVSSKL